VSGLRDNDTTHRLDPGGHLLRDGGVLVVERPRKHQRRAVDLIEPIPERRLSPRTQSPERPGQFLRIVCAAGLHHLVDQVVTRERPEQRQSVPVRQKRLQVLFNPGGPFRIHRAPVRTLRFGPQPRRRGFEHEPMDPIGMAKGQREGHAAAHRVADERAGIDALRVEDFHHSFRRPFD
jgi:hypothetical protein